MAPLHRMPPSPFQALQCIAVAATAWWKSPASRLDECTACAVHAKRPVPSLPAPPRPPPLSLKREFLPACMSVHACSLCPTCCGWAWSTCCSWPTTRRTARRRVRRELHLFFVNFSHPSLAANIAGQCRHLRFHDATMSNTMASAPRQGARLHAALPYHAKGALSCMWVTGYYIRNRPLRTDSSLCASTCMHAAAAAGVVQALWLRVGALPHAHLF